MKKKEINKMIAEEITKIIRNPKVHTFDSSEDAYNTSQSSGEINDGDIFYIPSEKIVGVMYQAWPVALFYKDTPGQFHTLKKSGTEYATYAKSIEMAKKLADKDGIPSHWSPEGGVVGDHDFKAWESTMKKKDLKTLILTEVKSVLKEWFPEKETVKAIEDLAKRQIRVWRDSADYGIPYTNEIDSQIKKHLTTLKKFYGGKAEKWGIKGRGGASYSIFIPIERSDYATNAYDGEVIVVSLHEDDTLKSSKNPNIISKTAWLPGKFYSIDIGHVTNVTQARAEKDYGCIALK